MLDPWSAAFRFPLVGALAATLFGTRDTAAALCVCALCASGITTAFFVLLFLVLIASTLPFARVIGHAGSGSHFLVVLGPLAVVYLLFTDLPSTVIPLLA